MILELDCGNSFIKWRVTEKGDDSIRIGGVVDSDSALVEQLQLLPGLELAHCRLVSVRTSDETHKLMEMLRTGFGLAPVCAEPARTLAGVSNGYDEYERLGLDRWLALVAGYQLARRACLVIDLGTAVTSDFVDSTGLHLGGFICPGIPLMRNQLRTHTRRIRYDDAAAERALTGLGPGHSTAEAVERGCSLMLRGFVQAQLEMAATYWDEHFDVFITGGDAVLVEDVIPRARVVPDLVFIGLALACPLR